ncbi:ribosomal RNA-processing protein 8 [Anoplophora glabripennis]|uniref:ribosomal RNA-processing protein 8 n=1 Tax=Anoplophora glabripennis TaxID=217634 RepID=UPI0008744A7C|nr:ribosomal RNA-processing protein 8 [Anoplophora glabripennis]
MKTFKAPDWDSDAEEDNSFQEMFKESLNRKKRDRLVVAKDDRNQKKLEKLFKKQFRDLKSNDLNVITVQTKIELGKAQKNRGEMPRENFEASKREKLRKRCKKSRASDSEDSEGEVTKKQKKMLKKYSSELNSLNSNSDKLSKELLKEKKKQKKLKRKLEKAARKQMLLNRAIEKKIVDSFENLQMQKIKKEPVDDIKKPTTSRKDKLTKTREKEKIDSDINIPESLRIAKKIQLQEKLKTILTQVQKRESKPKPVMTLRQKMMEKLKAARFRFLNEQIYTTDSKEAQRIFKSDPEAFLAYHEGYRQQVKAWPMNPLDIIIKAIKKMPKTHIVADFGCGEAKLAKSVPQKVHSFDLVAIHPIIIACDMAKVPLKEASIDVVVFCLSLMGTNIHDYLLEANRVLKLGGIMKIAEVESRFGNCDSFIEGIQYFGFKKVWKDLSHNLFCFIDFKKVSNIKDKKKLPTISLLPCLYKKR